jgi:tetratricopeptide (TPR) repeat protein
MKWRHGILFFATFAALATPSYAKDIKTVQSLIRSGDYVSAHDTAIALETADALALAAESLARQVMLGEVEKLKKTSKKARKLAEQALEIDPNHQNARLQYVITDGFVVRLTGDVSAWMKKLPQKSFAKIEAYRADFPDDPRGDALLAAWHLAVVRKAGNDNAKKWFEASVEDGQRLYESALAASPNDPVIALNYAFALIALDDEFFDNEKVKTLLEMVVAMPSEDDLAQKTITHANNALLRFQDTDSLKNYAESFLDGEPTI